MATFISLITFTDKGIQHVSETTERAEVFNEFTNRVGDHFKNVVYWAVERHDDDVVVKDIYWTHGLYDGIVILEAPMLRQLCPFFCILIPLAMCGPTRFKPFRKRRCG